MKTNLKLLKQIAIGFLFFLGYSQTLQAQSLRIVYDFIKDDVTYYRTSPGDKIGKEISSPIVGRNKMVQVEVTNFNKFVYAGNAQYTSKLIASQTDMSFMSLITPLVMPGGSSSFFTSLGGTLPEEVGRGGLLSTLDASEAYDDLRAAYTQLNQLEVSIGNMDYAIKKLNSLRYNPYLPTDTIVKMADYLVQMIFAKSAVTPNDFTNAIVTFNTRFANTTSEIKNAADNFIKAYDDYAKNAQPGFEGEGMDKTVRQFKTQVSVSSSMYDAKYITQRIDMLESIYSSIKSTSFTFNSSHAAKDDEIDLVLNFYHVPAGADSNSPVMADLNNLSSLRKVKDKTIKIVVRGDMKVNTSVGLGFPKFGTTDEFFNKDSVITSQSLSGYSPNLAGYVNFYPYTGRIANLGGTFGIGVPLNTKSRSVNMMMGAAALFGNQNRVALHGGLTLGQINKLDEGYKVGDHLLSATQEVPLRTDWEWGAFVGISFNLSRSTTP